jgi:hypothetical protein
MIRLASAEVDNAIAPQNFTVPNTPSRSYDEMTSQEGLPLRPVSSSRFVLRSGNRRGIRKSARPFPKKLRCPIYPPEVTMRLPAQKRQPPRLVPRSRFVPQYGNRRGIRKSPRHFPKSYDASLYSKSYDERKPRKRQSPTLPTRSQIQLRCCRRRGKGNLSILSPKSYDPISCPQEVTITERFKSRQSSGYDTHARLTQCHIIVVAQ